MGSQTGWPVEVLLPIVLDDHTWDTTETGYPLEQG